MGALAERRDRKWRERQELLTDIPRAMRGLRDEDVEEPRQFQIARTINHHRERSGEKPFGLHPVRLRRALSRLNESGVVSSRRENLGGYYPDVVTLWKLR